MSAESSRGSMGNEGRDPRMTRLRTGRFQGSPHVIRMTRSPAMNGTTVYRQRPDLPKQQARRPYGEAGAWASPLRATHLPQAAGLCCARRKQAKPAIPAASRAPVAGRGTGASSVEIEVASNWDHDWRHVCARRGSGTCSPASLRSSVSRRHRRPWRDPSQASAHCLSPLAQSAALPWQLRTFSLRMIACLQPQPASDGGHFLCQGCQ